MASSRILVVDDEERIRTFICDGLAALGTLRADQITSVSSAEEALLAAAQAPIDLIISDIRLPGLNGLDLVRQLRQVQPDTRIILITGYSTHDIERTAQALLVQTLLKKPFDLDVLGDSVQQALRTSPPIALHSLKADSPEVLQQITDWQAHSGANWIGLIDAGGSIVATIGLIDAGGPLPLTIERRSWLPLIRSTTQLPGAYFTYAEESGCDLYVTNIEQNYFLVMIYDRRSLPSQTSRLDTVWLNARDLARDLAQKLPQQIAPLPFAQTAPPLEP
jgi:CheY-like chemotaxis protein